MCFRIGLSRVRMCHNDTEYTDRLNERPDIEVDA